MVTTLGGPGSGGRRNALILIAAIAVLAIVGGLLALGVGGPAATGSAPPSGSVAVSGSPSVGPTASVTPTAASAIPTASATPAATPTPTLPATAGACLLPVWGHTPNASDDSPEVFSAGFVDLATLRYVPDPASEFREVDGYMQSTATPILRGEPYAHAARFSYDTAARRWLPVAIQLMEPNGARYVYLANDSSNPGDPPDYHLRIVDVATGAERDVATGGPYEPVAFTKDGIYLMFHQPGSDFGHGLWRLDPATGTKAELEAARANEWHIVGRYAWSATRYQDTVLRLDLSTGRVQRWYRVTGRQAYVVAVTSSGAPLISVWDTHGEQRIVAVAKPNSAAFVKAGQPWPTAWGYANTATGLWTGADHDLLHYVGGSFVVVKFTPHVVNTVVLGGCR